MGGKGSELFNAALQVAVKDSQIEVVESILDFCEIKK
jgi:hypothetical protein